MRVMKIVAASSAILVMAWSAGPALAALSLDYQGAYKLSTSTSAGFPYGARAAAYNPSGDSGNGSIYMTGHVWYGNLGESDIPTTLLKQSDGWTIGDLSIANTLQAPINANTNTRPGNGASGLEYIPGMDANSLFWARGANGGPDIVQTDLNGQIGGSDVVAGSPDWYGITGIDNRRDGAFTTYIPEAVRTAMGISDKFLADGNDWGPYGKGVSVYAYDGDEGATNVPGTKLIEYTGTFPMNDWDRDDTWEGAAWVDVGGDETYLIIAGAKDVTNLGDDNVSADDKRAWLMAYDGQDIIDAVTGGNPYDPQPVWTLDFSSEAFGGTVGFNSLAYDPENHVLYGFEGNSPVVGHVWNVEVAVVPEPATMAMLALGGFGLAAGAARRRHR